MTYTGAVGRRIHLGDESPGRCLASSGWGHLVPAPYFWAKGLASLALRGTAMEPSPSLSTSGMAVDLPALASTLGMVADPSTPASTTGAVVDPPAPTDSRGIAAGPLPSADTSGVAANLPTPTFYEHVPTVRPTSAILTDSLHPA